jgi:hypothetical protein
MPARGGNALNPRQRRPSINADTSFAMMSSLRSSRSTSVADWRGRDGARHQQSDEQPEAVLANAGQLCLAGSRAQIAGVDVLSGV